MRSMTLLLFSGEIPQMIPSRTAFKRLYASSPNQIVGHFIGKNGEDLEIGPADGGAHDRGSTRIAGLKIAGQQSSIQCRCSANKDGLSINIVFGKKSLFLCRPKWRDPGVHGGKTNRNLCGQGGRPKITDIAKY